MDSHPLHERTRPWTRAVLNGEVEAYISWPTILEVWSTLVESRGGEDREASRGPGASDAAISHAKDAAEVVERLLDRFEVVETTGAIYRRVLDHCVAGNLSEAGTLGDALNLMTAEMQGAAGFVTFRAHRFKSLSVKGSPKILMPPDPPLLTL